MVAQLAVPDKIFGLTHFLDFIDRCASNASLYLPQAALGIFAQSKRSTKLSHIRLYEIINENSNRCIGHLDNSGIIHEEK